MRNLSKDIFILTKYYYHYKNITDVDELREKLYLWTREKNEDIEKLVEWSIANCFNKDFRAIDSVVVTKPEMDWLNKLESVKLRQLMFTIVVFDKVLHQENHWLAISFKDIFAYADIKVSVQKQNMMFNELVRKGYVTFNRKVASLNFQINYPTDDNLNKDMKVVVNEHIGLQYKNKYIMRGKEYSCAICGKKFKSTLPNVKYCSDKCRKDGRKRTKARWNL